MEKNLEKKQRKGYNKGIKHKKKESIQMNAFNFMPEGWEKETVSLAKEETKNIMEKGDILQGIVENCDEHYNLQVKLGNGMLGIIPREEVEAINIGQDGLPKENLCTGKVHKYVQFKIKDIDQNQIPILSRKEVQKEALNHIKQELQIGQRVNGIVKNITSYGAFIEIGGGVVGLVHIEDLSVARIKTPFERLKIGQKLNFVVKSIDREQGKFSLSYKENFGTWEENAKQFEVGKTVKGIVRETEKNRNGIFVELTPNLVGMAEYQEGLTYGEPVEVAIKKIDYDKKKVKLIITSPKEK